MTATRRRILQLGVGAAAGGLLGAAWWRRRRAPIYDVCVIGSGFAGTHLALRMLERGYSVAVLEACNGLRMVVAFWVIGALVVLLMDRPLWQKIVVLVSCLPIALVCNTVRLTLTSVAFTFVRGETWEALFHDFGGYAMMPLALGMVMAEFWLLRALTTPPERVQP